MYLLRTSKGVACVQTSLPLRKSRTRGVLDSPSLIVYGNNFAIFPEGGGERVCTQARKGGVGEGYLFLRILQGRRLNRKGETFSIFT